MSAAKSQPQSPLGRAKPLIIARTAAAGISFLIPLALARAFPQEEYGTYKQLLLISQTLYYVLPLGLPQSLYYFIPRVANRRPYLAHALLCLMGMGALAAVVLLLAAERIGGWLNVPDFSRFAPALALYLFGLMGSSVLEPSLTARGRVGASSAFYLVFEVVKAGAMTVPALLGLGVQGVMDGLAAFALARVAVTWLLLFRGTTGPLLEKTSLAGQLRYALPFGAAIALSVPQQFFHQYVVSARFDSAAFALYSVGLFQLPFVDLLYTPTSEVLMVALGELDREGRAAESGRVFRSAVSRLAFVFIPAVVFLFLVASQFITVLFTERYLGSVPIFRVAVISAALAIVPLDGALRARGETWHIFASYVAKAAFTVPCVLLAVGHFGLIGGVGAWLLCEALGKAALFVRLPRALGCGIREALPWAELGRTVAAAALAGAGLLAFRALVGTPGGPLGALVLGGAVYGAGYLAATLLLGGPLPLPPRWLGARRQAAEVELQVGAAPAQRLPGRPSKRA